MRGIFRKAGEAGGVPSGSARLAGPVLSGNGAMTMPDAVVSRGLKAGCSFSLSDLPPLISKMVITVIFSVFFVISASFASDLNSQKQLAFFGFGPSYEDDSTPFVFRMGQNWLEVPRRYLTSRSLPSAGSRLDGGVHFTLLWSGLEPFSQDNADEFRRAGSHRRMHILLALKRQHYLGKQLLDLYLKDSDNVAEENSIEGFYKYKMVRGDKSKELFVSKKNNLIEFFILCNKHKSFPMPSCRKHEKISSDLRLTYSFSRKFITESEEINSQILSLFESFVISDPERINELEKDLAR